MDGPLERLLAAADQRGMVVNLMYFYQGQDELFDSGEAIYRRRETSPSGSSIRNFET